MATNLHPYAAKLHDLSLKSPVNYIVGVHTTSVLESEEDLELPSALVVYLDSDKI